MKVSDILAPFNIFTNVTIQEYYPEKEEMEILFEGCVCDVPFRLSNLVIDEEQEPFEVIDNELVITVDYIR